MTTSPGSCTASCVFPCTSTSPIPANRSVARAFLPLRVGPCLPPVSVLLRICYPQARLNVLPDDPDTVYADGELDVTFTIIIPKSLVQNKTQGMF